MRARGAQSNLEKVDDGVHGVEKKKKIVSIPQIDVPFAQYAKVITFDFANVPCDGMVFKGRSDRSGWQANSVEDKP